MQIGNRLNQRVNVGRFILRQVSCYHRVCIVGSGPSGFYSAKYLLDKRISKEEFKVDIIDKLPTPFGLVRYGVAPDHPEVKSVEDQFAEVANDKNFRFFGNIEVGKDILVSELREMYSAVILSYGAEGSRNLNIPGEDMSGILQARSFVNWYNGHPEFAHIGESLHLERVKDVVIIGQGNVALDCARVLCKPWHELASTDMTSDAIEHLQRSAIENIHIVGRRGYVQAACTIKELRELTQIPGVDVSILSEEIALGSNDASLREVEERRPLKRITQLMRDISAGAVVNKSESVDDTAVAATERSKSHRQKRKKIHIRFLLSPKEFTAATNLSSTHSPRGESDSDAVNGVVFEKCVLDGPAHKQRAIGTGRLESINCDLVLTSVGYKSEPLRDIKGHELPFDYHSNTIHHSKGRIIRPVSVDTDTRDANATTSAGNGAEEFRGLYVAGWLKRGPSGIIGTNITDAKETVQSVCEDALNGLLTIRDGVEKDPAERLGTCKIVGTGRNGKLATGPAVSWEQHLALDSEEKRRGEMRDPAKPREKITSVAEMLEIIRTT